MIKLRCEIRIQISITTASAFIIQMINFEYSIALKIHFESLFLLMGNQVRSSNCMPNLTKYLSF